VSAFCAASSRQNVVNRDELTIHWLPIDYSGGIFLIPVWVDDEAQTTEVDMAAFVIIPLLRFKGLKEDRESLLTIDYEPNMGVLVVKGRQDVCGLANQIARFPIHLPQK
jgi:hypothetical protein